MGTRLVAHNTSSLIHRRKRSPTLPKKLRRESPPSARLAWDAVSRRARSNPRSRSRDLPPIPAGLPASRASSNAAACGRGDGRRTARSLRLREQVGEEAGGFAQEGVLGRYPSELLEEREGYDLGVRASLEGGMPPSPRVEPGVGIVDLAEQNGYRLSHGEQPPPEYAPERSSDCPFGLGLRWPSFYLTNLATDI